MIDFMKRSKLFLTVLLILLLGLSISIGYFLLRRMQYDLKDLQNYKRSAQKEVNDLENASNTLKINQDGLDQQIMELRSTVANLNEEIADKGHQLAQLQKDQQDNFVTVEQLRLAVQKNEEVSSKQQIDYVNSLTGLEEKMNSSDKQLRNEIAALTAQVKALPEKKSK